MKNHEAERQIAGHGFVCKRAASGSMWRMRVWQVEFPSTVEAHPVRAVFDRKNAAQVTMSATKNKLENPTQRFHQSRDR